MDRAFSETEAYRIVHRNRSDIPDGHRRGWDQAQVPGSWTGITDGIDNPLADTEPGNWTVYVTSTVQVPGPTNPNDCCVTAIRNDETGVSVNVTGDTLIPSSNPDTAGELTAVVRTDVVRGFMIEVCLQNETVGDVSCAEVRGYLRG